MGTYHFTRAEKRKREGAGHPGYKGASIGNSGVYISKKTVEDLELSRFDAAHLEFDPDHNVMLVIPDSRRDGTTWKMSMNDVGGISIGTSNGGEKFYERFDMEKGRYEFIGKHKGGFLFKRNAQL